MLQKQFNIIIRTLDTKDYKRLLLLIKPFLYIPLHEHTLRVDSRHELQTIWARFNYHKIATSPSQQVYHIFTPIIIVLMALNLSIFLFAQQPFFCLHPTNLYTQLELVTWTKGVWGPIRLQPFSTPDFPMNCSIKKFIYAGYLLYLVLDV